MLLKNGHADAWPEIGAHHAWLMQMHAASDTPNHYRDDVRGFARFVAKPISDITFRDVDAYIVHCHTIAHAASTIKRRLAAVRDFFRFVGDFEIADVPNPVVPRRHKIKVGLRLPRDISDRALRKLLRVVAKPRDRAMMLMKTHSRMRISEVINAREYQLQLDTATGMLPRIRVIGKGNKERAVPLSPECACALRLWLKQRNASTAATLFVNRFDQRFHKNGIYWMLNGYCRAAGLDITPHQLRHTFARQMTESGMPVTSLMQLLGHRSLETTRKYIHLADPVLHAQYRASIKRASQALRGAA